MNWRERWVRALFLLDALDEREVAGVCIPIITPLILFLFRKANDFQIPIETKGFGAPIEPTEIETLSARWAGYVWLALSIAVVGCTVLEFSP
jgi:energy-coupling factor transporter transmembrane protein EcfT